MELLKPDPDLRARVRFGGAAMEVRDSTLAASLWSLTWKSCSGVLSEERASMWWRCSERVVEDSGSDSVGSDSERASDSGHERVGGWGRVLTTRVCVWK